MNASEATALFQSRVDAEVIQPFLDVIFPQIEAAANDGRCYTMWTIKRDTITDLQRLKLSSHLRGLGYTVNPLGSSHLLPEADDTMWISWGAS